ncbi:hypothetical protein HK104_006762 [Borealophlyctis nickersoniae]|nr:hypothetical protein HK104_006762 [Borealophlyctis nickersoniae]
MTKGGYPGQLPPAGTPYGQQQPPPGTPYGQQQPPPAGGYPGQGVPGYAAPAMPPQQGGYGQQPGQYGSPAPAPGYGQPPAGPYGAPGYPPAGGYGGPPPVSGPLTGGYGGAPPVSAPMTAPSGGYPGSGGYAPPSTVPPLASAHGGYASPPGTMAPGGMPAPYTPPGTMAPVGMPSPYTPPGTMTPPLGSPPMAGHSFAPFNLLPTPAAMKTADMRPHGPYLRLARVDLSRRLWGVSVLMVIPDSPRPEDAPVLTMEHGSAPSQYGPAFSTKYDEKRITPIVLDKLLGFTFWRFEFPVPLLDQPSMLRYSVIPNQNAPGMTPPALYWVNVPACNQEWRWVFYSCNGFSLNVKDHNSVGSGGGFATMWNDLLKRHAESPFHCLVGGGDQLYNDGVFKLVPECVKWLEIKSQQERERQQFTPVMANQVEHFYLDNYVSHFAQPSFSVALATIPNLMMADDHDIFDGWGSYPAELQQCPVFQGIGAIAQRFYWLFQLHTRPDMAANDGYIHAPRAFSWLHTLGPSVAILGVDTRTERSKHCIVSPASYEAMFASLQSLPPSVKHLNVLLGVPIVYPRISLMDGALQGLSDSARPGQAGPGGAPAKKDTFFGKLMNTTMSVGGGQARILDVVMQKTGVWSAVMSPFGEPELLDDLVDHWTNPHHETERRVFIERLQAFALERSIRVTFLGGDVHCCGAGRLYSTQPGLDPARDHRYMLQIISSAIVNTGPPAAVITMLHASSNNPIPLNDTTMESMLESFPEDSDGTSLKMKKLNPRRNYCIVSMPGGYGSGELEFVLRVEHSKLGVDSRPYVLRTPPLIR